MIADDLYKQIVECMPILCVDVVIRCDARFLLAKRKMNPAKGLWWMIGGRVRKNEGLEEAVRRKCKKEAGIKKMRILGRVGIEETMFDSSAWGTPTHTVNIIYLVEVDSEDVVPDETSDELKWFDKIDGRWHDAVQNAHTLAGF